MAITSYPRVTIQGSGAAQNPQNGQGLMILNPSTGLYEAATAATFAGGGGGGGDATAANQSTQITEAQTNNTILGGVETELQNLNNNTATSANQSTQINEAQATNSLLNDVALYTNLMQSYNIAYGKPAAEYLNDIANNTDQIENLLNDIKNLLTDIKSNQTTSVQKTQIVDAAGNAVNVESNKLYVIQ